MPLTGISPPIKTTRPSPAAAAAQHSCRRLRAPAHLRCLKTRVPGGQPRRHRWTCNTKSATVDDAAGRVSTPADATATAGAADQGGGRADASARGQRAGRPPATAGGIRLHRPKLRGTAHATGQAANGQVPHAPPLRGGHLPAYEAAHARRQAGQGTERECQHLAPSPPTSFLPQPLSDEIERKNREANPMADRARAHV